MSTFRISEFPNDLTIRLLAQGCTPENHPANVKWNGGPGEFEYTTKYLSERTYEMPCGLLWRGKGLNGYMSYGGVIWRHENDNPTVRCPYIPARMDCPLRDPRLGGGGGWMAECAGTPTDKPYDKAESLDTVAEHEQQADAQRAAAALKEFANEIRAEMGSFCPNHAKWDRERISWDYHREYDPNICPDYCKIQPCLRCGAMDEGIEGNVLYDIHQYLRREDGSMFDGEWNESILRGVRVFEHPRRLAICQMTAQRTDYIMGRVRGKREYRRNLFFEEHYWHGRYRLEVENVRVVRKGAKDVRDLMADLQAAKEGIAVAHASDIENTKKALKKEHRNEAKAQKARKTEELVLGGGYAGLEPRQQARIEKILGPDRLEELLVLAKRAEKQKKPEQLSLFTKS